MSTRELPARRRYPTRGVFMPIQYWRSSLSILVVCASLFASAVVYAQPEVVPIQGVLTDDLGAPISGIDVEITFSVYDSANPAVTTPLHTESILLDVEDGAFLHYLGVGDLLDMDIFDGSDLYLGISVEGESELLPRLIIGTTPYAAYATQAGRVDWSSITGIPADIADGDDDTTYTADAPLILNVSTNAFGLSSVGCSAGDAWVWNGTTWVCDQAVGDAYDAGAGLSVASNVFSINAPLCGAEEYSVWTATGWSCRADLGIRTLGAGAGISVLGNQIAIAADACGAGQYLTWDGAGFNCVDDVSTSYTGGTGIAVVGNEIQTDAVICAAGQVSAWTALGWTCVADQVGITTLESGDGISVAGNEIAVAAPTCDAGQYLTWTGASFACVADASDLLGAGDGLELDGLSLRISAPECQGNEFLQWDGTTWGCAVDQTGITSISAGDGIGVSGSTVSVAAPTCAAGQYLSWTGSAFTCVADVSEALAAGDGLALAAGALRIDAPTCQAGRFLQWNGSAWGCADDDAGITELQSGNGITTVGNTISVAIGPSACGANQYLSWTGTGFTCKNDVSSALTAGHGLTQAGSAFNVNAPVCQGGRFLQWNGTAWGCADDNAGITSLVGGAGIVTNDNLIRVDLGSTPCGANQYLSWTGTGFTCKNDVSSALSAGAGISLAGNAVSVTAPTCQSGSFLQWTGTTWGCATDQVGITSIQAGNGIAVTGNQVRVALSTSACGANQYLTWTGTGFTCKNDVSTAITAGTGINISGGTVSINSSACAAGQFSRWTASGWACATPAAGITTITGTGGVTVTGTGASRTIGYSAGSGCGANQASRWTGSAWACLDTVTAGAGITVSNRQVSMTGLTACAAGSANRWTGSTWQCTTVPAAGITNVTAGSGITVTSSGTTRTVSINFPSCAAGAYLRWTGSAWQCTQPVSAGSGGITVSASNQVSLNVTSCGAGQASRWTGTAWQCINVGMTDTQAAMMRAHNMMTGGGITTLDASYNLSWNQRFIIISAGRGAHFASSGHFGAELPPVGTVVTGHGGNGNVTVNANGIPIPNWSTLYYELPIGSTSTSLAQNFRVVNYTSAFVVPDNWIPIATRNNDRQKVLVHSNGGVLLSPNQSYDTLYGRRTTGCAHAMRLVVSNTTWPAEHGLIVRDAEGREYFRGYGINGTYNFSVPPGRYEITAYDGFGDGWNGNTFRLESLNFGSTPLTTVIPNVQPLPGPWTILTRLCDTNVPNSLTLTDANRVCAHSTWFEVTSDCRAAYAEPRVVHGYIETNGAILGGAGFSVSWASAGRYMITFDRPFMGIAGAGATQVFHGDFGDGGNTRDNALISGIDHYRMRVITGDSGGSRANRRFTFSVAGY